MHDRDCEGRLRQCAGCRRLFAPEVFFDHKCKALPPCEQTSVDDRLDDALKALEALSVAAEDGSRLQLEAALAHTNLVRCTPEHAALEAAEKSYGLRLVGGERS